jgi:hypothetical protein
MQFGFVMMSLESSDNQAQSVRRWNPDAVAITVLILTLVLFYWGFWMGRSYISDDTLTEFYPGVNYFAKSIHVGRFPLWFSGVRDGLPFYSDPQMTVFYPPQWFLVPFVEDGRLPFLVYQRYIVLHYILGGLLMYAFLKRIKLSPLAALIGALVFCLSGFASLRIVNFVMMQVYAWLPLQLLCVHRLTSVGGRRAWLGLVGVMLLSLLAGHQQTTVYCWYLVIAYWLYRCYCLRREQTMGWKPTIRQLAGKDVPKLIGTFILVFGLSAIMLIPGVENWLHTGRPRQSFENVAETSLPYDQLLTQLVPNFFGKSQFTNSPVAFWGFDPSSPTVIRNVFTNGRTGYWLYWEFGTYAGQIFWVALLLILGNWRSIKDRRMVGFFLATWVAGTWFMLGQYGGLYQVLYYILPGASMFRGPAKMSCVTTFAAAVLSACSVDLIKRRAQPFRCWPVFLPAVACACLALALFFGGGHRITAPHHPDRLQWSQRETLFSLSVGAICGCAAIGAIRSHRPWVRQLCLCSLLAVVVADFYHAYGDIQRGGASPDRCFPETDSLLTLLKSDRERWGPYRFGQIVENRLHEEVATFQNLSYFHDFLEVPEGYTSFYLDKVARFQSITNENAKFAIQNIKAVALKDAPSHYMLAEVAHTFPRAQFFSRIHYYDSDAALLEALDDGKINWSSAAAVRDFQTVDKLDGDEQNQETGTNEEVQFESVTPEKYIVSYNLTRPGIIFVSQTFYPGWVTDNERTKLIEVFGAFQGIVIPEPGRGRVVARFSPSILRRSLAISIFSIVITFAVVRFGRWNQGLETIMGA